MISDSFFPHAKAKANSSKQGLVAGILLFLSGITLLLISTSAFAQVTAEVDIKGVSGDILENVRLFLGIEQQKSHTLLTEARIRRLHSKAVGEITRALQPFGYYRPEIRSELKQTSPNVWLVSYQIEPGPPLPIKQLDIEISGELAHDKALASVKENLEIKQGAIFNHRKYESIKAALAKLAAVHGYVNARFAKHLVEIDLQAYEARIQLHFDSGPRFRFGDVRLKQEVLEPELLLRYVSFKRGDPYNLDALIDLQHALNDSDYFRNVEVSPGIADSDHNEIPVNVNLTPRKHHRYSLGMGYGTDTGARAKFGWEIPRLNLHGHRLGTEFKISEIGYGISAIYRVPVLNPRTDQMVYSIGEVNEKTEATENTVRTVGATLNRSHGKWRESVSINYQQESYRIADVSGKSTLLIPGVSWRRIWAKKLIYLIDGLRFDIGVRGASDAMMSDTGFLQAQSGLKGINPWGEKIRVIAGGRLGATWTDYFQELPSSVRFFAGGSQSVRGYAYNSLGPTDDNNKVVGGKYLMIGSVELEYMLIGKWGIALFYDAGNAIDNFADKLERGTGFGLRWQSPIGPVRIDMATALTVEGRPWRLHINIGPDL